MNFLLHNAPSYDHFGYHGEWKIYAAFKISAKVASWQSTDLNKQILKIHWCYKDFNICTIVQADDKGELRKKMRSVESDYRMKLKDYYSGISCSGNSLIRTALLNNAVEAGELLVKKMPKSDLQAPEADGKTLQAWVAENGLQDNPIAAVLNDRL